MRLLQIGRLNTLQNRVYCYSLVSFKAFYGFVCGAAICGGIEERR